MHKETRGRKKNPYKSYRKRYPEPCREDIDKLVDRFKRANGYV